MDRRLSRSMPMLALPLFFSPVTYRAIGPRWPERRPHRPRHFYVGGVRTQLIGADSYPNPCGASRRLIVCGPTGSYQKLTRNSSTAELSRTGVYCSVEDLRPKKGPRRAASYEHVCRGTTTITTTSAWDSKLSESGVSLSDSRTDLGSYVGLEDVDRISQSSFGSSSAFHEITCDSELDRHDSDSVSVPGSGYGHDRSREVIGQDRESRARRRERSGGGGHVKTRHDSGSREKFLSELTASSGRSSPTEDKEFYHSTPTKRGSPVLSIFPADEEDLHFPSNFPGDSFPDSLNQSSKDPLLYLPNLPKDSLPDFPNQSTDSLPNSPTTEDRKKRQTSAETVSTTLDTVTEALKRRRREFFSSLQDCSKLEEQSAGDTVQSWLTTGHPQRHSAITPGPASTDQDTAHLHHQPQHPHQRQPLSPPSPAVGGGISVRDRVRAIEQSPSSQTDRGKNQPRAKESRLQASGCSGENGPYGAAAPSQPALSLADRGGAEGGNSQQLYPSPAAETASLLRTIQGPPRTGDVPNVSSADGESEGGFNAQFSANDNQPLSDSSWLNNRQSEQYQHSEGRVSREFGTVSGQSEEDRSYLLVINDEPVTLATDQLWAVNDGTVSDVDRQANTGANTTTDSTQALQADCTLVSGGLSSAADVCRSEASFVSVSGEEEESDDNTEVGDKDLNETHAETAETTSAGEKQDDAENPSDGDRTRDALKAVYTDKGQNAESVQLVPISSATDNTSGVSKKTQVEKEAGRQTDSAEHTTLYHARPIHIVPSEEAETHFSQLNALHPLHPVTASSHPCVSADRSTPPSFQSSASSPSESSATPSPLDTPPSSGPLPDGDDTEVESVLAGDVTQPGPASCEWRQHQLQAAAAMDHHYHQGLSTDHTDSQDSLTIQEASRHHTRHVHRTHTTVQETVTTRHTAVRPCTGSPTSALGEGDTVNGQEATGRLSSRGNREAYDVTDKTVSRTTVTEEDSEREETTTRSITRQPLSQLDPGSKTQSSEHSCRTHPNYTPAECTATEEFNASTALTDSGQSKHLSAEQRQSRGTEDAHMMAGGGWMSSSCDILDSLQEQLSLLSSESPGVDDRAQSSQQPRQLVGYMDYAEASLPHRGQTEADSIPHSSNTVRGSGSVVITLDRNGPQPTGQATSWDLSGSRSTDWKTDRVQGGGPQDTTLYRARAIQIVPTGEEGNPLYGDAREDPAPSSRFTNSSLWAATASSPEVNDSDDHYTSISTTDSSHHHHHHYPYSDSTMEGRTEDGISGHDFHDFLSGQFSSDQPSLHRSVDMIADDFQPYLHHPSVIQETIVEADDERGSAEEDVPLSPTIHSFKSSLHFSVTECTPTTDMSISPVPQTKLHNTDQDGMNISSEDRSSTMSSVHPLQDLSDRLSSIGDVSYELHIVRSHDEPDHPPACVSPTPSDVSEESIYSTTASAEVRKMVEQGALHTLTESTLTHKLTARRLSATMRSPKKSQWVQERVLLFQKLLNDLEWQTKTSEQKLMEEMVAMDKGRGDGSTGEKQSELCDDLYRSFTREYLENRQNHVCPIIEDHLPVFRFRRFLRKKHNSKLKGHKTFRIRHQLERLMETLQAKDGDVRSVSDVSVAQTRQSPYQLQPAHRVLSPAKLRGRVVSDVFTDDADVNRSFSSDSAYSSLSGSSSRHVSDLDSTFRSVGSSRADVSSIATDVSMDIEKLKSLSDVFDQLDVCEGEIDTARLDRLRVGHSKAETL